MERSDYSLTHKQAIIFATIAVLGVAALLLGLVLIIFAHYHERAYIFLGLGAAGFIGGIAGIVGTGSKARSAAGYSLIALGMMGMVVGLNYLVGRYGPGPNQAHGYIVIVPSIAAILVGIVWTLITQPRGGIADFFSVILLGVIASAGIAALIAGTVYLVVLQHQHAHLLLGVGAICLVGGVASYIFVQHGPLRAN